MSLPTDLRYKDSHEWIQTEGEALAVGITDHAQEELTDIVYVELPEAGKQVKAGDPVAVVESVKSASDIYAPISGEIVEGNELLGSAPQQINDDAFGQGWIFKIKPADPAELDGLMDSEAYASHIG